MFTIFSLLSGLMFLALYLIKVTKFSLVIRGMVNLQPIILIFAIGFYILYYFTKKEEKNPLKYVTYFLPQSIGILSVCYFLSSALKGPFAYLIVVGPIFAIISIIYQFVRVKEDPTKFMSYVNGYDIEPDDDIIERDPQPGDFVLGQIYKKNLDEEEKIPEGEDEYIPSGKNAVLPLGDRFVHVLVLGVTGSGKTSQTLTPMVLQDFISDDFRFKGIDVVQMGQIVLEPKGDFAKTAWAIGKIKEEEKRANYINYLLTSEEKIDKRVNIMKKQRKRILERTKTVPLSKEDEREYQKLKSLVEDSFKLRELDKKEQVKIQRKLMSLSSKKRGRKLTKEEKMELRILEESLRKIMVVQKNIKKVVPLNDYEKLNNLTTHAMFKYASYISDITHEPGEADVTWAQIKAVDPKKERDVFMLFDPSSKESPYFNPLYGPEDTAVGTVTSTLISFMEDSSEYFKNLSKTVVQRAIRIAKRVHENDATLLHVDDILTNNGNRGEDMIAELLRMDTTPAKQAENKDITDYFLNNYYPGMKGARGATRDFEQSSGVRNILNNLLDNEQVRHVLNPPKGIGTEIDFDEILKTGDKVALSTSTGASDAVGRMLGSFLILQLQEAIFRRKGKDGQRIPVILYIDEFQDYASSSFEKVLTQGRSYAVSSTMATQTLGIVEQQAGKGLVNNLQSNARNVILYPGSSAQDAKYFVSLFGGIDKKEVNRSISQEVKDDPKGINKILSQISSEDSGGGSGPRESISERVTQVERFTESHIIYGPNYKNKGIGGNDAFGFVYYRIVVDNNVQVPAIAKIQYIPRDIKDRADEIIEAYDSIHLANIEEKDEPVKDEGLDLLEKENQFKKKRKRRPSTDESVIDDPRAQARGKDGQIRRKVPRPKSTAPLTEEDITPINDLSQNAKKSEAVSNKPVDELKLEASASNPEIDIEEFGPEFIESETPDLSEFESMMDDFDLNDLEDLL